MKQKTNTRKSSYGQDKDTSNNWKNKAIIRGQENLTLRKRVKELTESRDSWKKKYKTIRSSKELTGLEEGTRARQHQYSLVLVVLFLELQKYGQMSLRSCRHSIGCMLISLGLSSRLPSHTTLRNWLCKSGIYRVLLSEQRTGNYVLYVDESIVFGSEKMLLIIGVSKEKIPEQRSLCHSDMEVLYVGARNEWKGEDIEVELRKIGNTKTIDYIVSDEGNNLRKSYKSLNYSHIEDCTHILANHLKRLYDKDKDFELFRQRIGILRKQWNLSKKNSQYMPPTMRGKLRFANIFPCVDWAAKQLNNWANLSDEVQKELAFLQEKKELISSLIQVTNIFKIVSEKLKNEGFGTAQKQFIVQAIDKLKTTCEVSPKASIFIDNCNAYLVNLTIKSQALGKEHLLCSSDIIESYFGKFKAKINPNNHSGLTEFIFSIANFSQTFSTQEVKCALENIKISDLKTKLNSTKKCEKKTPS